jgi:hypothetical protein
MSIVVVDSAFKSAVDDIAAEIITPKADKSFG